MKCFSLTKIILLLCCTEASKYLGGKIKLYILQKYIHYYKECRFVQLSCAKFTIRDSFNFQLRELKQSLKMITVLNNK